jgi:hypothetical protein
MSVGRSEALQLYTFRVPNGVVGPNEMKVVSRHTRASTGLMTTFFSMAGLPLSAAESIRSDLNEYSVHCPASINLTGHRGLRRNLGQPIENAHRVSSCSGRQFHGLMQVVSPGERAELIEGEHRVWIVWPILVRSQPWRFLPSKLHPERGPSQRDQNERTLHFNP